MRRKWGSAEYATTLTSDNNEGWIAMELHATVQGKSTRVARVVFWDADGQFSLELSAKELPLVIVEELIVEAKRAIATK